MAVLQSPRAYSSPTRTRSPSPSPAISSARWSTPLAALAQPSLADPVVGSLARVVIPLAIGVEVGTVLAPTQPVPLPVVRLAWLPVPEGRGQQPAREAQNPGQGDGAEGQTLEEPS